MENKEFYYTYDEKTKKFLSKESAQIDPLESELAGKTIFCGKPQNSTYEEPLSEKAGFNVVWNGESWEYQEISEEKEAEERELTELEQYLNEYFEIQSKLSSTDYINDKINDAVNTNNLELAEELRVHYKETFEERAKWREKAHHLKNIISQLKGE